MNIGLRKITDEDLPFLMAVYISTRKEEVAQTGWPIEQQMAFLEMQFQAQHQYYQQHYSSADFDVVLLDETPVGRLYVDIWPSQIRIVDIAMLSEYRSRGIGRILISRIFEKAKASHREVSIHVENNNPAMHWYKKLGFNIVEGKGVYSLMQTHFLESEIETLS